ncbi:MAG: hypothetical protein JWM80_646 [Cyanobacteria bacterium RYN_339]|nr:hypothetical protein [Cyanobacteria bacterium RYN_339]
MEDLEPFTVGQLVLTSLESFFSAASLHLGDALPDGRKLDATDPQEAWRALLAASALLNQFAPLMADNRLVPYQAGLEHLLQRLGQAYPEARFAAPAWLVEGLRANQPETPVASLVDVVREGLQPDPEGPPAPQRSPVPTPRPPTGPLTPGTGLPQARGSGPLFRKP